MTPDPYDAARARIAEQRGELRGWRPLTFGDIAVTGVQVLGMAKQEQSALGIRVAVAGRTREALAEQGPATAERALRARAVLGPADPFTLVHIGDLHDGNGTDDSPLAWPWVALVIHVPEHRLPAIAGLTSDTVPSP